ncbi:MAG: SUF system NifU family Fe-S cluster assembly protein [Armatimonadota bacterium]
MLNELYREIILDHYRHPRGRGHLDPPKIVQEGMNPLCGDEITLELRVDGGIVEDIKFSGQGCSISQASASMLVEAVRGKRIEEVESLIQQVLAMLRGETEPNESQIGEIAYLAGVRQFPVRVKCATLAWHTLEEALQQHDLKKSPHRTDNLG